MGRRKKGSPGALSQEMREMVLMALAEKAAAGDISAARIFLDEHRRAAEAGAEDIERGINARILCLADLINNPEPDRDIENF